MCQSASTGRSVFAFCLLPSAFILLLLVANSAAFLFQQPFYETWDLAANSLSVERAKHFAEWYGPYSRWGFHHPGPAYFYALALGEWLFYDKLHVTPAPYNAQVLTQLCISTAFFGAALSMFARRLTRAAAAWFWPLAIVAGALHFGFAARLPSYDFLRGPSAFASTWSAHEIVMPFLCLLVAGASVAAGNGAELPLLAVSAGTLLHLHVAQPLFVVPMVLLAGVGMICGGVRVLRPWHVWSAGLILAAFAWPLARDLFRGEDSNFAAILHHLRTHHGEHKSLVKSVLYFLQFGAYTPYQSGRLDFGHFDGAGALAYLGRHALLIGGWLLTLLAVAWITARGRFLRWEGWFLLTGIVLTLYWGTIQDGEMFYYNAWLNFALYFFGLLIVIAKLSTRLEAWPLRIVPAIVALVVCVPLAPRWRVNDPAPETTALVHASAARVLAATPPGGDAVLEFGETTWPVAAALGLEMVRAGRPFEVTSRWVNVFGPDHDADRALSPGRGTTAPVPWRFRAGLDTVPWRGDDPTAFDATNRALRERLASNANPPSDFPLPDDTHLDVTQLVLSVRSPGAEIDFQTGGNAPACQLLGWSDPEPWGTWTDGHRSVLRFNVDSPPPGGSGGGVEIAAELHPFIAPLSGLTAQRIQAWFGGAPLGPTQSITADVSLTWTIPAAQWDASARRQTGATLEFTLPDAAAPAVLDPAGRSTDTRLLGVGVRRLRLRLAPPR